MFKDCALCEAFQNGNEAFCPSHLNSIFDQIEKLRQQIEFQNQNNSSDLRCFLITRYKHISELINQAIVPSHIMSLSIS